MVTDLVRAIYGECEPPVDEAALWRRVDELSARYPRGRVDFHRMMALRYRDHQSRRAIAELFGVHQSRIQQIEAKMLRLLRHPASRAKFEQP